MRYISVIVFAFLLEGTNFLLQPNLKYSEHNNTDPFVNTHNMT